MSKRPYVDKFAEMLVRQEEEKVVQAWLTRFRQADYHGRVMVMMELLKGAMTSKYDVDTVREVVKRGRLLDVLQDATLRLRTQGVIRNPKRRNSMPNPPVAVLPVGATFYRRGLWYQVVGRPRPWGRDVLVPVRSETGLTGSVPGSLKVSMREWLS